MDCHYQQISLAGGGVHAINVPAGAKVAWVQPESAGVRMKLDGSHPTSSTGELIAANTIRVISDQDLVLARFVAASGSPKLNVTCFRGRVAPLFDDRFTAPNASTSAFIPQAGATRQASPGPGSLALVSADGEIGVQGGALAFEAQASPAYGDLQALISSPAATISRDSGYGLLVQFSDDDVVAATGALLAGLWPSSTLDDEPDAAILLVGEAGAFYLKPVEDEEDIHTGSGTNIGGSLLIVPASDGGAFFYLKIATAWYLLGRTWFGTTADLYAGISSYDYAGKAIRRLSIIPLPLTQNPAYFNATPASGTAFAAGVELVVDFKVTQAGSLTNGHAAYFEFQRTDANNCLRYGTVVEGGEVLLALEQVSGGVVTRLQFEDPEDYPIAAGESVWVQVRFIDNYVSALVRPTQDGDAWTFVCISDEIATDETKQLAAARVIGSATLTDLTVYNARASHVPNSISG